MLSGASPTRDQKTSSASPVVAHRRVAHLGAEQHRTGLEAGQPVARAAQLARHDQRVVPPLVPEHPKVRVAEDLGPGLEGDAVGGHRDPGALLAVLAHAVEVHADLVVFVVDVHIGRRDMGLEVVLPGAGTLDVPADGLADGFECRAFGREVRYLQRERPRRVRAPRAGERIGEGQPDVRPLVVREVQVVATERLLDPVRDPDERRAVDVGAHPFVHVGPDDRLGGEPHRSDVRSCRVPRTTGLGDDRGHPARRSSPGPSRAVAPRVYGLSALLAQGEPGGRSGRERVPVPGKRAAPHYLLRIPITLPLSAGAGSAAWARAIAVSASSRSGGNGAERPVVVSTCMHMISFVAAR